MAFGCLQAHNRPAAGQLAARRARIPLCLGSGRLISRTASGGVLHRRASSGDLRQSRARTTCKGQHQNGQSSSQSTMPAPRSPFQTGGTSPELTGGTLRLTLRDKPLAAEKFIVVVRHGLTTWNQSKRIQGDSDEATLTPFGEEQAERVKAALSHLHFDSCLTSPIQRAYKFAEIAWGGRTGPVVPFEKLKEANLGWLQGMSNADAARERPEEYKLWRERPADFWIDGRLNPLNEVFERAKVVWEEVLEAEGHSHLLVTHKSIMRAMMCVALGLPTSSFRAVEINNGGVSTFRISVKGEPMLVNLNMTAHMHVDNVTY